MNLRSLFLIFVVMVMMCGSASATDYYDAFNSSFESGSWITTFSGTYTEEQTEVTGVEVRP